VKQLFLLRHAKSSWDDPALSDHDRPLAPRGRRAAKVVAGHLRRSGIAPDLVLCSSERRTRETLERIASSLGGETSVLVERELYGATEGELLERLRRVPETVRCVMMIGHNPGIERLALRLAGGGAELAKVERKYPTGALAALVFEGGWGELRPQAAELVEFVRPKDLG
jgi:phosphohistidine phosphatase